LGGKTYAILGFYINSVFLQLLHTGHELVEIVLGVLTILLFRQRGGFRDVC
jgi:hypothetical protein